jgi:hypothetical protein
MEKFKGYSFDKAKTEANKLEKLVQSGQAPNLSEAEKLEEKFRFFQSLIWNHPTDETVNKLSKPQDVPVIANTRYNPAYFLPAYDSAKIVEKSGTRRLIDLGSSDKVFNSFPGLLEIEKSGIEEYIAVDMGISDEFLKKRRLAESDEVSASYEEPSPEHQIKTKAIKGEILAVLHSFPENYANAWMTGLDAYTFHLNKKWILATLSELKRVVPQGGFVITDAGCIDLALSACVPQFEKIMDITKKLHSFKKAEDEDKEESNKFLTPENDPLYKSSKEHTDYPLKYKIEAPEIGFTIYYSPFGVFGRIVLINSEKTKEQEAESQDNPWDKYLEN